MSTLKLVVLGSTRSTNMQAIVNAIHSSEIDASIEIVISNRKDAYIIQRSDDYHLPNKFISAKDLDRPKYDNLLIREILQYKPDLILLIGYMRILGNDFINVFDGKILNIHPSLLPKHAGLMDLMVHQSVLDADDVESGCTVHQVNEQVDGGKIELQLKCAVEKGDTAKSLKQRVQALESKAWIEVIKGWIK